MIRALSSYSYFRLLPLVFIALLAFLITSILWLEAGIPHTADAHFHLHRTASVQRAFEQGVFWPRWFPSSHFGRGEATFHYYSPGLYWLLAAIHATGIGLDQSLKLLVTTVFILSGLGIYAWLRHTFSSAASLASASLYLGIPHIYSRTFLSSGDYLQLMTFLLVPVCLWAFTALFLRQRIRYWLAAVLALTVLVFSHQQQVFISAGALLVYCLLLAAGYRRLDGLARCAVAALLAALLSAAYWLPSLGDMALVNLGSSIVKEGYYGNFFLSLRTLFSAQPFIWDSRAGNPLSIPHDTFGVAQWLTAAAGLASLVFWPRVKKRLLWCSGGVLFTLAVLFLTLPNSDIVWKTIPGLKYLQFPFRLLPVAVLGALPAAATFIDAWPARVRWLSSSVVVIVALIFPFPYLFPALASQTTFVLTPTLSAEETRSSPEGVTSFLPQNPDMDVIMGYKPEPEAVEPKWLSPHEAVADLSGQTEPILLRLNFHPGWSAGSRAKLSSGEGGWAQVTDLRTPDQPLTIRWEGTAWQSRGERLSLLGLLAGLAGLLYLTWRQKWRNRSQAWTVHEKATGNLQTAHNRVAHWALFGVISSFVVARFAFSWFDTFPFLYNSPPGQLAIPAEGQPIALGDANTEEMTMLGWQLMSGSAPKPGDTIVVRIYWQPVRPISKNLNTFVHLYSPALQRSWAIENQGIYRPSVVLWSPNAYYLETMRLKIPVDVPPVTYSLVAGLVFSSGERLAVPGATDGVQQLRTIAVSPLRSGVFQEEHPSIGAVANTSENLKLQGYDLLPAPGGADLRLFWETEVATATDWITYVHLLDDQGELVAQFDGPSLEGLKPTSEWQPRELHIDRRHISLPLDLPAGDYLFRIGLYNRDGGERLPLLPEVGDQLHFENGQLLVPLTIP